MKLRLTIFAKIVLWFFLNLALVVAVGWIVVRVQVKSGLDSFIGGYIGQRLLPVEREIMAELEAAPREQWDAILLREGRARDVQLFLINIQQQQIAGEKADLPEAVRRQLPRGPRQRPEMSPPPNGRDRTGPLPRWEAPPRRADDESAPGAMPPEVRGAARPTPVHQTFFLRTDHPKAYWEGLYTAMEMGSGLGQRPAVFLVRSKTFSAGGLFFDATPWILLGVGMVLLSALLWLPLVRDFTHTIRRLTHATRQVADGQFDVRVNEMRGDELGQLGSSVNRMTVRLEGFVKGQKHFLGAIAHELCSPLARLQMALGILEQHTDEKQARHLEDLREEVQHMSDLVNELLSFSKASLKPSEVKCSPVNIRTIAEWAVRREAAEAEEVKIQVPDNLNALANAELLQRALANLVRNALRYAGNDGPVEISAHQEGDWVEITVADHGPGIPEEHLENAFEMFYRIEADRARDSGGVGLGLAIVRQCVEACGGTVTARNRQQGGLRVSVRLQHNGSLETPAVGPGATSEDTH